MKTVLKLTLFASLLFLIAMGCKKVLSENNPIDSNANKVFDPAFVKEWYYRDFIKSAEFASNNQKENGIKLPDWKNGKAFKMGEVEIVEFPLKSSKKLIGVSNSEDKNNAPKIVAATIQKIVFARNKNNTITIKVMQYVPTFDYLTSQNFDISNLSINNYSKTFKGTMRISNWAGKVEKGYIFKNDRSYRLKEGIKITDENNIPTANRDCGGVLETWFEYECNGDYTGDVFDPNQCKVTFIFSQTYTPNDCGPDPEECNEANCMCANYGVGCETSGGTYTEPEEDCSITANKKLDEMINNSTVPDEPTEISILKETSQTRTKKYQWVILRNAGWYLYSFEKGVHVKTGDSNPLFAWRWESLEHQGIGRAGTVIGGNVDYGLISAIPELALYTAGMDIDFKVTYSLICKGSPLSLEKIYNSKKIFSIYD